MSQPFINTMGIRKAYLLMLSAARSYYWGDGDKAISDLTWDVISRELYEIRDTLPIAEYPVVHHPSFLGGSLYFLSLEDYDNLGVPA